MIEAFVALGLLIKGLFDSDVNLLYASALFSIASSVSSISTSIRNHVKGE